jgi:membrane dipeptidase
MEVTWDSAPKAGDFHYAPAMTLHRSPSCHASLGPGIARTRALIYLLLALVPLLGACATASERARDLHFDSIVIDGHSDTTPRFEDSTWDFATRHDASDGTMDLPRIRDGGLDVQFWSIYMGKRDVSGSAIREALERIDAVHQMAARHPNDVVVAGTVREIRRGAADGKLVSLMGVEGGHIIENSLPVLRTFYRLGVRYMTLTHSFHTDWADSSGTTEIPEPVHGGLTDFGREIVTEMNRLGMLVDISHVSDATFFDAIETSRAPVIASHSSTRAIADHPRNMTDKMLEALAQNGGVIMINFYPAYIDETARDATRAYFAEHGEMLQELYEQAGKDRKKGAEAMQAHFAAHPVPQTSLDVLLDHFDHAIEIAGPHHVGIGGDWDGVASMPVGMEEISQLPSLTVGLLSRGHSAETIRGILGNNLLRVLEAAEQVSREMREEESSG